MVLDQGGPEFMNNTLIEQLARLNEKYPFRVFELETLDGCRIRVTKRYRTLYGEEQKTDGDIRIENDGLLALLRYNELKDVIYFVPPWKRPLSWLYDHPQWIGVPLLFLMWGVIIGLTLASHWKP